MKYRLSTLLFTTCITASKDVLLIIVRDDRFKLIRNTRFLAIYFHDQF